MLNGMCLALSLACFASFVWAVKALFAKKEARNTRMAALSLAGFSFFLWQVTELAFGTAPPARFRLVAIALYLASAALFWWSVPYARAMMLNIAFTATEPWSVLRDGPYRHIRHPFYTSYALYWLAGACATGNAWYLLALVCMGWFYLSAANQEEREFLQSPVREDYTAYCDTTRRFIPGVW